MILVVGATGQLGSCVVRLLREQGRAVRVMVRTEEAAARFEALGCESYVGDITHPGMAKGPFPRIETVIATANASVPSRRGDSFAKVEDLGYANLIAAAVESGAVRQFIYPSFAGIPGAEAVPLFQWKRINERRLADSGLGYTIFRFPDFLDTALPMMGSDTALMGSGEATLLRPFAFVRNRLRRVRGSMERKGEIHISGDGSKRHAYLCVEDAARLIVASIGHAATMKRVLEVTGPSAVSDEDVARICERVLGRMLKRKYTPAVVLAALAVALRPFQPAAANLMAIQYLHATTEWDVHGQDVAKTLGVELRDVEGYLRAKLGSPAGPPAEAALFG